MSDTAVKNGIEKTQLSGAQLTPREQEILNLLLEGISTKEIAFKLSLSVRTVDFHRNNIYNKLDVHNYHELIAKVLSIKNKQEESKTLAKTEFAHSQSLKSNKLYKILISAGIFALSLILILNIVFLNNNTDKNKPSDNSTHGEIKLTDGSTFYIKTFDLIQLKALKHIDGDDNLHYYWSDKDIFLSDIYDGDVKKLIPYNSGHGNWLKLRLSGKVDKELDHAQVVINLIKPDGKNHHLASCGLQRFSKIGPGDFSEIFYLSGNWDYTMKILNQDELPEGKIIVEINHVLNQKYKDEWLIYNGEIPDYIPNGTVMATIRDLKIEPVF